MPRSGAVRPPPAARRRALEVALTPVLAVRLHVWAPTFCQVFVGTVRRLDRLTSDGLLGARCSDSAQQGQLQARASLRRASPLHPCSHWRPPSESLSALTTLQR